MKNNHLELYRRILETQKIWTPEELEDVLEVPRLRIVEEINDGRIPAKQRESKDGSVTWSILSMDLIRELNNSTELRHKLLPYNPTTQKHTFNSPNLLNRVERSNSFDPRMVRNLRDILHAVPGESVES